jgi:inosine-uridine nucleoside N-ribohydrolase
MSQPVNTTYFQRQPQNLTLSIHTDIGTDPDDILGLFCLLQGMQRNKMPPNSLKEIVTTLYKPDQKADIAAKICHFMKYSDVSIYPGYGSTPDQPADFMKAYPFWPIVWGIPGFTNVVSLGQGKGYENLPFNKESIIKKDAALAIQETVSKHGENEIILGLAPCTDLSNVMDHCSKINRIILMGGYFGKEVGNNIEIARAGYNTAVDPNSAEKILTQTKHPVLIFNSQHITNWKFSWMQEEILAILCSKEKTDLGDAIAKDLAHYWSNKKLNPFGSLVMADVLTAYVGVLHPELIKTTMPVAFHFNSKTFHNPETNTDEPIHMLHPQAKTLFTVTRKDQSNVHIVTELSIDPEILRKQVVEEIAISLFFKDKESFHKAVQEYKEMALTNDQITKVLAKL